MRRFRKLLGAAGAAFIFLGAARAQPAGPLNPPAPLARPAVGGSAGSSALTIGAARRAHDLGLPMLAADLYRQARDESGGEADRAALTLALATALLDAGQAGEAEKALAEIPEPHTAAWHLRAGLAAVQLKNIDAARAEFAAIKENEVPESDYPWYWFFQGELVDLAPVRDITRANSFYNRAQDGARTEQSRALFQLAAERVRLEMGSGGDLRVLRQNYEANQSNAIGYGYAATLAVAMDAAGQKGQAVTFLQGVLVPIQRSERVWWDKLRLVLGLIGDKSRTGAGRNALAQLIENGNDPERQRQGLQILAKASTGEAERRHFRDLLKKLIDAKPDHPIKESLLFYRAQLALAEKDAKDFALAEEDAKALLNQYPRSPLRVHAYGVLAQSAWEQRRYRQAADNAQKARAELAASAATAATAMPGAAKEIALARVQLGVLAAEAWFRAGLSAGDRNDFRLSADAYAAVLRDRPPEFPTAELGGLMFQRVLAEIKSGSSDAGKIIDELTGDPAFDLVSRWEAEWSLARALQLRGEAGVKEAYARVSALLREPAAGDALKPELRSRMAWLQARLAFENKEPEEAIKLVDTLVAAAFPVEAGLRKEIESTAVLLKAQAEFALGREPVAIETLKALRDKYAGTDAAASSFLIESEYFARQEKIDEARNRLISLIDSPLYPKSEYVPLALFSLALLSERLGRPENLLEANKRIEDLIEFVSKTPGSGQADLIFDARMKQGDILRKRNDFPAAQRAYEELVNKFSRRPDVVLAWLRLAETHNALSTAQDRSHAETARTIFEQLRDRVDAPADVRVEAGYNLGKLLEGRGKLDEAARVWWTDVAEEFLIKATKPFEPGAKRPYWLARTLIELGDLRVRQEQPEEARRVYRLVLERGLPYAEVARSRLEQYGVAAVKPTPTP